MKISQNNKAKLFSAIDDPIMDLGIRLANNDINEMDHELFDLSFKIHDEVCMALNIGGKDGNK